jgi:inorganic pyrophosphatase
MSGGDFWRNVDALVASATVIIDRPKGSAHPRYPDYIYPLDYGYLEGTVAVDGGGVDVWIGSLPDRQVTAVVCTVDLTKSDAEVKILLGCTPAEAQIILAVHNQGPMAAILVPRGEK